MSKEELAIKIGKTLQIICPSFSRDESAGHIEWHKCCCKISDGPCTCVWHLTDTCVAGEWAKLSFVKDCNNKTATERNKALAEATRAANNSNNDEKGVDDRFEILDL